MIQTANTRMLLRGKYASAKLFQANQNYSAGKHMEVPVQAGDLVGVIQQKDPMGDGTRWYVDIGTLQGFLPSHVLSSIGADQGSVENSDIEIPSAEVGEKNHPSPTNKPLATQQNKIVSNSNEHENISVMNETDDVSETDIPTELENEDRWSSSNPNITENDHETRNNLGEANGLDKDVITTEAVIHAYDDVAPDQSEEENVSGDKTQPVRKAPAPPTTKSTMTKYVGHTNDQDEMGSQMQEDKSVNSNPEEQKSGIAEEVRNSSQHKIESQEEIYGITGDADEEAEKGSSITVNSNSSGNSNSNDYSTNAQMGQDTDIERTGSHHSYEEIPPSEANSEVVFMKSLLRIKT